MFLIHFYSQTVCGWGQHRNMSVLEGVVGQKRYFSMQIEQEFKHISCRDFKNKIALLYNSLIQGKYEKTNDSFMLIKHKEKRKIFFRWVEVDVKWQAWDSSNATKDGVHAYCQNSRIQVSNKHLCLNVAMFGLCNRCGHFIVFSIQ